MVHVVQKATRHSINSDIPASFTRHCLFPSGTSQSWATMEILLVVEQDRLAHWLFGLGSLTGSLVHLAGSLVHLLPGLLIATFTLTACRLSPKFRSLLTLRVTPFTNLLTLVALPSTNLLTLRAAGQKKRGAQALPQALTAKMTFNNWFGLSLIFYLTKHD